MKIKTDKLLWRIEKYARTIAYRYGFFMITKDVNATLLLSQIVFWFEPRDTVTGKHPSLRMHRGKFWLPRLREKWVDELGLTSRQFDRALKLLVSMKIIERDVFIFKGPETRMHLHLNEDVLELLVATIVVPNHTKCKSKGITQSVNPQITQSVIPLKQENKSKTSKTIGDGMDSGEILKTFIEKQKHLPKKIPVEQVKVSVLWEYWAKAVKMKTDMFLPEPKGKLKGMFGHWIKRAGAENAYPVMIWCVQNWDTFRSEVEEAKGSKIGKLPTMEALLPHVEIAVTIAQKAQHTKDEPVQSIAKPKKTKFVFSDGSEV